MASEDKYKEGVDFKWVKDNDGKSNFRTRKFFTKAEKEAMKAPKKAAPVAKAAPKKVAPAVKREAPVTKDAMKGYRKGDVLTAKIPAKSTARANARSTAGITTRALKALGRADKAKADADKMPVPGRAIVRAFKNALSGKGETDAAKISARGYAKGGMVTKKKC